MPDPLIICRATVRAEVVVSSDCWRILMSSVGVVMMLKNDKYIQRVGVELLQWLQMNDHIR